MWMNFGDFYGVRHERWTERLLNEKKKESNEPTSRETLCKGRKFSSEQD